MDRASGVIGAKYGPETPSNIDTLLLKYVGPNHRSIIMIILKLKWEKAELANFNNNGNLI